MVNNFMGFFDKLIKGDIENEEKKSAKKPSFAKATEGKGRPKKLKTELEPESKPKLEKRPEPLSAEAPTGAKEEKKEKKGPEAEGELAIDVYETKDEVVVETPLAGIDPKDVDISVENEVLTIKYVR